MIERIGFGTQRTLLKLRQKALAVTSSAEFIKLTRLDQIKYHLLNREHLPRVDLRCCDYGAKSYKNKNRNTKTNTR